MEKAPYKKRAITYGVQFKFVAAFLGLLAALLGLLNVYPLVSSRDLIFKEKESSLMSQASVITSSLAALDSLSADGVGQVMELLDVTDMARIIVTDAQTLTLYDTAPDSDVDGDAFAELSRALSGEQRFRSLYSDGAFLSCAALPVRSHGMTLGAVYLCEYDSEQAQLLMEIQNQLLTVSLSACVLAIVLIVLFSRALTARITKLAEAMRVVRAGDYAHRLELSGNDELTELGDEFNNLTVRLETTESQRRRFVSDASHELKTPLASIRLLSDSIVQNADMDADTMREFVTDIGDQAERLQRTTDKLLNLSRRDDGATAERVPVDMSEVARSTLRLLTPLAKTMGLSIETALEDGLFILASEDEVYQIIFNLAENAVKYNSAGGRVFIDIHAEGETVLLIVEDDGIGIPEADREQVFSRFYRVDKDRSRASGGSGLGLSIVHDAVTSLGGDITLSPVSPHGTRFSVSFPRWEQNDDQ